MVVIEQGRTAEAALDAVNGMIDNITKTAVFSRCRPVSGGEIAEEQWHIDHNLIDSRGRDLRCLNNEFVSARGVSRDIGTDVTIS